MLTLNDARRIIAAAEKKASEIGQPMNIAVADAGGNLIAHVRMDGANSGTAIYAMPEKVIQLWAWKKLYQELAVQHVEGFALKRLHTCSRRQGLTQSPIPVA